MREAGLRGQPETSREDLHSARHGLEARLARSVELFQLAPIGCASVAADGSIFEINQAAAAALGTKPEALVGSSVLRLLREEDGQALAALLGRVIEARSKESIDCELVATGARPRQLRFTAAAAPRLGQLALLAVEDVTELREREAQFARTEQALREASQRKDEFLAVLSHELRNPLAPIRNSIFLLEHAELPREQHERALSILNRQVAQLAHLIDDLLDIARIAQRKIQLRREVLELAPFIQRTLDDHRMSFDASGVRLESELESGSIRVSADATRLTQALSNLLVNALKFTPAGGKVVVSLRKEGQQAKLRVSDTGAGIHPSVLERLFEPFAQAPQTIERTRGGLGLGLATAKGLIELHGGRITMASAGLGQGAEATIYLPLDEELRWEPRKCAGPHASAQGLRVLVIEDNIDAADTLRQALAISGHQVAVSGDGQSGLAVARTFMPEVVICDIGLSDMDGCAVAKAFRSADELRGTYLLALSGYAQSKDVQRALAAGFNEHLAKPASMTELNSLLARARSLAPN